MTEEERIGNIERIIREVMEDIFQDIPIEDVSVETADGAYGDPIINIRVVMDVSRKDPDGARLSTVTRRLREKLEENKEMAFPVVAYMSSEELGETQEAVE